jgi:membrane protease YdiL (CAAX protease family)
MKDSTKMVLGLIITVIIYSISVLAGKTVKISIEFIPEGFANQLAMMTLTGISLFYSQSKGLINFNVKRVNAKLLLRIILTALITFIAANITAVIAKKIIFGDIDAGPSPFSKFSALQYFIFLSIIAPVTEEFLFRGFLYNMLAPLKNKGLKLLRTKVSVPVIVSGILFGLSHLILLTSGADLSFVIHALIFTTIIGIMNGYLQEKHENNTLVPIIAHITINTIGFFALLFTLYRQK